MNYFSFSFWYLYNLQHYHCNHANGDGIIISPNDVFGDIMILASQPSPRPPPVDPDDVSSPKLEKYSIYLFQILYICG